MQRKRRRGRGAKCIQGLTPSRRRRRRRRRKVYSRADAVNEEDPERDRARRRRNGWAGGLFFESTSPFTLSVLCSIIFVKCVERSSIIFVIFDDFAQCHETRLLSF